MFKFIHVADVHLDNLFATKDVDYKNKMMESQILVMEKIIEICLLRKVDGLLIAGDLFESQVISFKTENLIMSLFETLRLNGIQVYYSTGNHDANINSQVRKLNWPANVHIFDKDQIETFEIKNSEGKSCKISGCGHVSTQETRNLVPFFPVADDGAFHIGVLHTMVSNADFIDNNCYYLPCKREDLEEKKYSYWALGHIHKAQKLGKSNIYYSGNPQGLNSKETGEKGVNFIEIDRSGSVEVNFIPTSCLIFKEFEFDITGIDSFDDLISNLIDFLKSEVNKNNGFSLIPKINLIGKNNLKKDLKEPENLSEIIRILKLEFFFIDVVIKIDRLRLSYSIEELTSGNHVVREVIELIDEINYQSEVFEQIKNIKMLAIDDSDKSKKDDYLLDLVKNLKEDIIEVFLEEKDAN